MELSQWHIMTVLKLNFEDEYVIEKRDANDAKEHLYKALSDDFPYFFCVEVIREYHLVDNVESEEIETPAIDVRIVEYVHSN